MNITLDHDIDLEQKPLLRSCVYGPSDKSTHSKQLAPLLHSHNWLYFIEKRNPIYCKQLRRSRWRPVTIKHV